MEIHKPHAAKTRKEFLVELGTVVLGILIALGLEQSVEAIHESQLARDARAAIREEMTSNVARLEYRLSYDACIQKRLDQYTTLLADWADGKVIPAGIHVGYPGDVLINDQRWQANLNSGRFSREGEADQTGQTAFYTVLHIIGSDEVDEHITWEQLRAIDQGSQFLTLAYRPRLIETLLTARAKAAEIAALGAVVLRTAKDQNLLPSKPFIPAERDTTCQPLTVGDR